MAFVYPTVAIAAGVLGPNRLRRAPNVQRESCLSDEDEFLSMRLSARHICQLALQYIQWRHQVDGANVGYYTSTEHVHEHEDSSCVTWPEEDTVTMPIEYIMSVYRLHIYRVPRK